MSRLIRPWPKTEEAKAFATVQEAAGGRIRQKGDDDEGGRKYRGKEEEKPPSTWQRGLGKKEEEEKKSYCPSADQKKRGKRKVAEGCWNNFGRSFAVCSLLSSLGGAANCPLPPLPPPSLFLCSCFLSRAREIYLAKNFCTLVRTSFFLFRGRNIDTGEERERDRRREISLRWLRAIFQDFG